MSVIEDTYNLVFGTSGTSKVIRELQDIANQAERTEKMMNSMSLGGGGKGGNPLASLLPFGGGANPLDMIAKGFQAEINFVHHAIEVYTEYGKTLREVISLTGETQQQAAEGINLAKIAGVSDSAAIREQLALVKDLSSAAGKAKLASFGIHVTQGESASRVIADIKRHIDALPPGLQRSAELMQIFGRRGVETYNALSRVSERSREIAEQFSDPFNTGALEDIQKFQESVNSLGVAFENGILFPLAQKVLPILTDFADDLVDIIRVFDNLNKMSHGVFGDLMLLFAGVGGLAIQTARAIHWMVQEIESIPVIGAGVKALHDKLMGHSDKDNEHPAIRAAQNAQDAASRFSSSMGYGAGADGGGLRSAGNDFHASADSFRDSVADFGETMRDAASAWKRAGGKEIPYMLTEADFSFIAHQRAMGAVG